MKTIDVWATKALDEAIYFDSPVNGLFGESLFRLKKRFEQFPNSPRPSIESLEEAVKKAMERKGY